MKQYKNLLVALFVLFLLAGCENLPFFKSQSAAKPALAAARMPAGVVVAKVGNFYITQDELNKEVEAFNNLVTSQGVAQDKIDTRDKKITYLRNELVRKYMLYQEALDRGMDKKEDMMKAIENAKISLLVSELVRQELEKIEVASKEIEDFYNQNKDALREPEQRKISEIVTKTEDEAKQAYIELLKGTDFATMAKQYSKGSTAAGGGDVGFLALEADAKKRIRPDKFYEVAFGSTLEAGGISSIFKAGDSYYIIKLESVKKSEAKPLSEVWDGIKSLLLYRKQNDAIAQLATRLSGETKVEIYEAKVE